MYLHYIEPNKKSFVRLGQGGPSTLTANDDIIIVHKVASTQANVTAHGIKQEHWVGVANNCTSNPWMPQNSS